MGKMKLGLVALIALFAAATITMTESALPQEEIHIPQRIDRVSDYVDVITAETEAKLNEALAGTESSLGLKILVLTLASTKGVPVEEYGAKVLEAWGIDKQNRQEKTLLFVLASDDGVYGLVKTAGLDSLLSDKKLELISQEVIMPQFVKRNMEAGIVQGLDKIIEVYAEGLRPDQPVHTSEGASGVKGVDLLGIGLVIALVLILALVQLVI